MKKLLIILLFPLASFAQADNKEYVDQQIQWIKIYTDAKFESVNKAVDKVAITNENAIAKVETTYADYRATQNEWRGQIKDAASTYVTRGELWSGILAATTLMAAITGLALRQRDKNRPR
jgi:hypothetical protein